MGKTFKNEVRFTEDEEFTDAYIAELKKKSLDKRKEKRLNRALKTKDIEELMEMDEYDSTEYGQ